MIASKVIEVELAKSILSYEYADSLFVTHFKKGNYDSTTYYARRIIEIGEVEGDFEMWLDGCVKLGVNLMNMNELDSSSYYFNLVLDKTEDSKSLKELEFRSQTLMYFGVMNLAHYNRQNVAFRFFKKAVDASREAKVTFVYVRASMAIIEYLNSQKRYKDIKLIIDDIQKYLDEYDVVDPRTLTTFNKARNSYLASVAETEKERKVALDLMLKEYKLANESNWSIHSTTIFIQIVHHFRDDMPKKALFEMAEYNLKRAASLHVPGTFIGGLHGAYGSVLVGLEKYNEAIPYLEESKQVLFESQNVDNYLDVCIDLGLCYEEMGMHKALGSLFRDYRVFQDSFNTTINDNQLLDLQEKYNTDLKESENVRLATENDLVQSRFRFSAIVGTLLLFLLIAGFYLFQKLKKSKYQLERLNREKNNLFAILAHDLRNPIASLSNLSQKVAFLTKRNRLNELNELAKNTDAKLNALNDNLNNILLWAITESNIVSLKPVKVLLHDEINKINDLYADAINRKEILIENTIPTSSYVYTDLTILQTIIRNLISNAVKFSDQGGVMKYSLLNTDAGLELQVIDKGIGLFNSGETEESPDITLRRNRAKGTGIGLKICKELAVKSNINLDIKPNPEGGAVGVIRFAKAA